eukprot:3634828-Prymnesium_polylepis.1
MGSRGVTSGHERSPVASASGTPCTHVRVWARGGPRGSGCCWVQAAVKSRALGLRAPGPAGFGASGSELRGAGRFGVRRARLAGAGRVGRTCPKCHSSATPCRRAAHGRWRCGGRGRGRCRRPAASQSCDRRSPEGTAQAQRWRRQRAACGGREVHICQSRAHVNSMCARHSERARRSGPRYTSGQPRRKPQGAVPQRVFTHACPLHTHRGEGKGGGGLT